jgi:anti-sigma B factor antagonist
VSAAFAVAAQRVGGGAGVVEVTGELDIYTAPQLKQCMLGLFEEGVTQVVVDLGGVTFIDSTALGVLIGGVRRVNDAGGAMALVVSSRQVARVLAITGLDRVFAVCETREAALAALV